MKFQRREKILACTALGVVGLTLGCFFLLTSDGRSDQNLLDDEAKLTGEIASKQKQMDEAAHEQKRIAEWRRHALPPDAMLARSLYQDWLHGLASRASFHEVRLTANDNGVHREQFTRISFALNCTAKLGDLIQFMYEFYSAGLPSPDSQDAHLPERDAWRIGRLIFPSTPSRWPRPSEGPASAGAGHSLQLAKLADYRDPIVSRNLFTAFVPPSPPVAQKDAGNDPAATALVTGFTQVDGSWQVWIEDRSAGSRGAESGESFNIGDRKCTVQTIRGDGDVTVELDRCRRQLRLGTISAAAWKSTTGGRIRSRRDRQALRKGCQHYDAAKGGTS